MKRIIAIILAAGLFVGLLSFTSFASDWGAGDTLDDALSELKVGFDDTQLDWLVLPGLGVVKLRYTYFLFKNERTGTVDEKPVYCIDPTLGGAHEIVAAIGNNSDGSRTATYIRGERVGDEKYAAILAGGYPHQMFTSFGLQSREEGYYATKLALWCYIRGNDPSTLTINPAYGNSDPAATRVRAAAIAIYNNGMTQGPAAEPRLTLTGKPNSTATLQGEYYVQEIEVYASGWIGLDPSGCGDVQLSWASAPPSGTIVLGTSGEDISSTLAVTMAWRDNGWYGHVTIKYPASGIDSATFSPPTLNAEALVPNDEIYTAYAKAGKDYYQRYLVERDPKKLVTASFGSQITGEPPTTDTPQGGGLRIRKVETGTNKPLEGAVFEILDPDGKRIYSLTTDASGTIEVPVPVEGNYTVTELTPPQYHLLPRVRTQSVYIRAGETGEVTFENAPYGSLRVVKRDAANGKPLAGAAVRIKNIVTNATQEGLTDSSGSVVFTNLPVGGYEIVEITAPEGYALDSTVHTVNVTPLSEGETSYVLVNKANPGLRIIKFDRQTMTPIAGVTFEIWRDGELFGSYVTEAQGQIELHNLAAGTYLAREVATPNGYVLDTTAQWIELKAGQGYIAELIFFNIVKPGMRLVKVDSETLQPLANAKFRIASVGGSYANEFVTNSSGEIDLSILEPGAYTVTETAAPDGYLIDYGTRTIQLNPGETAQFVFTNTRRPAFELMKLDSKTGKPLAGATFRIALIADGSHYLDRVTGTDGKIRIDNLSPGLYSVQEMTAPEGFVRDETEYHVQLFPGKTSTLVVSNDHKPDLRIVKTDKNTGAPIAGAVFTVRKADSATVTTVTTGANGEALIVGLDPGVYEITEKSVPEGYILDTTPQMITLFPNREGVAAFQNYPKPWLEVWKYDEDTAKPLPDAEFSIRKKGSGVVIYEGLTNKAGYILLENLDPGWYTVDEIAPPPGYLNSSPNSRDVYLEPGKGSVIKFDNKKEPSLIVWKYDEITAKPLADTEFSIARKNGPVVYEGLTGSAGFLQLQGLEAGWYVVTELAPPPGYLQSATPSREVYLEGGKTLEVKFDNVRKPVLVFLKTNGLTGKGIPGATFKIEFEQPGGGVRNLGSFKTGADGRIILPQVSPGWYIITETLPAPGYSLPTNPVIRIYLAPGDNAYNAEFEHYYTGASNGANTGDTGASDSDSTAIDTGADTDAVSSTTSGENTNYPLNSIVIKKTNAITGELLAGAAFELIRADEQVSGVPGTVIGRYTTDNSGVVVITGLEPGYYVVKEVQAPPNFSLSENSQQNGYLKADGTSVLEFTFANYPFGGLVIRKLDSQSKEPLKGAEFMVTKADGSVVGTSNGLFVTDSSGIITIPNLPTGSYIVRETKAPTGYLLESNAQTIAVDYGKTYTLTFENTKLSGAQIIKIDADTKQPLKGAKFNIYKKSGDVIGTYETNVDGVIILPELQPGWYKAVESKAPDGYILDDIPQDFEITSGQFVKLVFENKAMSGFRIRKIDSVTKAPIYGAEFMIFDSNNKVVGNYTTDNNGIIDFLGDLAAGRYTIRETKPAPGYYTDDMPRTVELGAGKVTEIVWENTPQAGQIQITKLSGDDNEICGLPKGSPLAGAVFEVYEYKSGNLVDRFQSGTDGRAVSRPLPLGRYVVKEVQAPAWYKLSSESIDIEIEFATQIIKREFLNYSANTGVRIKKTGPYEAMPGDTISYTIKEVGNTSTVPLTDFYWRDVLPTDAVSLTKILTGTYNQSLKYKILVTTNKGDTRIIADNLSTTQNNAIDCRAAALGLANDEYVTSFTLIFGTVKAGFCQVTQPQIYVTVKAGLPGGYLFANRCDVGGKYGSEWVVGASSWVTTVYALPVKLPRTGY